MQQSRYVSTALGIVVLLIAAVLLLALFSIRVVGVGEVGVISTFGEVDKSPRDAGLQYKLPWQRLTTMNVRTQEFTMSSQREEGTSAGDDTVRTLTSEGLTVGLDITVLYQLLPKEAPKVLETIGEDYRGIIIRPNIRNAVRDVVAQYSAADLYTIGRAKVGAQIFDQLKPQMETRGILVQQLLLRDVTLPPQIQQAIENKLAAEQAIQERGFRVQEAEQEAKRKVAEAEGQKLSQELINSTLTDAYLKYLYLQSLANQKQGNVIYVPVSPSTGLPVFISAGETGAAP